MSNQNPRIALTVPEDLNALLGKIAHLQKTQKTKIILELLLAYQPVLAETLIALEKIEADKQNAESIAKDFAHSLLLEANSVLGDFSKEVKDL